MQGGCVVMRVLYIVDAFADSYLKFTRRKEGNGTTNTWLTKIQSRLNYPEQIAMKQRYAT